MLSKFNEEDFYKLKNEVAFGRLAPVRLIGFFFATFFYSTIIILVSTLANYKNVNITNPIWPSIMHIEYILLTIQFLVFILYTTEYMAYKFQKLQAVLATLVTLKFPLDLYIVYFLGCEDKHTQSYMTSIGIMLLIGGVVFTVISIIRALRRVSNGQFRKGGRGMYDLKNSKGYSSAPLVYALVMFAGQISRALSGTNSMAGNMAGLLFMLFISVVLHYAIALAWPEFLLLTYCKFRFKSFQVEMTEKYKKAK